MASRDFVPPKVRGYELVKPLGRGEWGSVFLYKNTTSGAAYACKFLNPSELAERQQLERGLSDHEVLLRESLRGNTKSLPGIAYGSLEHADDGTPFLRLEPLEGSLDDHLDSSELTLQQIIGLSRGIASGLESMHSRIGAVHGDLHPRNIGYNVSDGEVKLIDFGTSTIGNHGRKNMGYLLVRAPERFSYDTVKPASDVWAFGANLYRFFTGKFPFEEEFANTKNPDSLITHLSAYRTRWNDFIREKLKSVKAPRQFKKLLFDCLRDEEERIQDGAALVSALDKSVYRYERGRWPSRARRWGSMAATLAVLAYGGNVFRETELEKEAVERDLIEQKERESLYFKINNIRLHQQSQGKFRRGTTDVISQGSIEGYLSLFDDDPLTGYAAYLDPEIVRKAIHINNGKTDFDSLKPILRELNSDFYWALSEVEGGAMDGWAFMVGRDAREKVRKDWKDIGNKIDAPSDSIADK